MAAMVPMESLVMVIKSFPYVGVQVVQVVVRVLERQVLGDVPMEMPEAQEEHQQINAAEAVAVVAVAVARMIMMGVTAEQEEDGQPQTIQLAPKAIQRVDATIPAIATMAPLAAQVQQVTMER